MIKRKTRSLKLQYAVPPLAAMLIAACSSDAPVSTSINEVIATDGSNTPEEVVTDGTETPEEIITDGSTTSIALSCEEIATKFVTNGSANIDLPDPVVGATCVDGDVIVTSNQIPDFPYIVTSPGNPEANNLEYTIPATPLPAETITEIPALGAVAIAINGIPIFGATEGTGGDVLSLPGGFNECGGHNGPTGYHYHTLSVVGSDYCLFSEAETTSGPQLFGYAFDGYPIYTGNTQYTSSWSLTDPSLFATDTFSAHTFTENSGDLDQCNGRTDAQGNYAYYTTDSFPYVLGCYRGVVELVEGTTGGPGGGRPAR